MDAQTQNELTTIVSVVALLISIANLVYTIMKGTSDARQKISAEYDKLYSELEDYMKKQKNYIEYMEENLGYIYHTYSQGFNNERSNETDPPEIKEEPSFPSPSTITNGMERISPKIRQSLRETSNKIEEIKKSTTTCVKEQWVEEGQRTNFIIQGAASCAIAAFDVAQSARKKSGSDSRDLDHHREYFENLIEEQIRKAGEYEYLLIPILRTPNRLPPSPQ